MKRSLTAVASGIALMAGALTAAPARKQALALLGERS